MFKSLTRLISITITIMAVTVSGASIAATHAGAEQTGNPVLISDYPRVMIFNSARNSIDVEGRPLVCLQQFRIKQEKWADPVDCIDANGRNAWSLAVNALPGYSLKAYEYRLAGSGGYQHLILYFSK